MKFINTVPCIPLKTAISCRELVETAPDGVYIPDSDRTSRIIKTDRLPVLIFVTEMSFETFYPEIWKNVRFILTNENVHVSFTE